MLDTTSKRVLLAEDHPVNQRVATVMLESLGFRVDVVADGAEAVKAATQVSYHAILMDCEIPILDGYDATAEIRRVQGPSRRTPIIAVTASDTQSDQEHCLAVGMDDYLVKPLSLKTLSTTLERWTCANENHAPDDGTAVGTGGGDDSGSDSADGATFVADPAHPVLDVTIVARLERLGEAVGEDLMGQLAVLFMRDADARIVELHAALASSDAAAVVRCAHSMNGASGNLGATHLARLFSNLEADGGAGNLTRGGALLEAAEAELERVRAALGALEPTA